MQSDLRQLGAVILGLIISVLFPDVILAELPQAGTFRGVIKLDGEIPVLPPLVKKNNPETKDAAVCAASTIPDESLVVDRKSRGIADVFVYLRKRPDHVPEDDTEQEKKPVVLEQKGCRYVPHAMIVRTNQKVKVVNRDEIAHNAHSFSFKNPVPGYLIPPNKKDGLIWDFPKPEIVPIKVSCDIHPWMTAWMFVVDHPFAAVTDKEGKFEIDALPPGEYEFRIWQEKAGYLEKKFLVKIEADKPAEADLKYPAERFIREEKE